MTKPLIAAVASVSFVAAGMAGAAPEEGGPLIERDVLFGNPERAAVRLSPDGKTLSYSAPLDGVMNLWVAPIDDVAAAKAVTADTGRGITNYFWAYTNRHLVYLQDDGGNENNNLYVVDLDTGETRPLDVDENVRAQISGVSKDKPTTILVGLNRRSPMFHDLYTVDLESGEQTLHFAHPGMIDGRMVAGLTTDPDYAVRFATVFNNDGGLTIFQADDADEGVDWQDYETIAFEDSLGSGLAGFTDDGQTLYAISSKGRDTAALYAIDPDSDERTLLAADERADVGGSLSDPQTGQVQAVSFNYDKPRWEILDDAVAPDVAFLDDLAGNAEWGVTSRTLDDATWMVYVSPSDGPTQYYLYDRSGESPQATPLFTNNPKLEGLDLRPMTPVVIEARDGLEMVSYLTLPAGVEMGDDGTVTGDPVPAVLVVHGGPWARDSYGYNPLHQWLANRGYAVLSPNFRGSTGFGKSHVNAGNKEWGQAMQDDLTDAKAWLVEQGIAEPDKVAIMGGSYGGYAALAGVTLTPDEYALGVSIVGPSNIKTLLSTIPPYWAPAIKLFHTRVGNPADEADSEMLDAVSPLNHIDKIAVPLLIGQGANDPRVKQSESDQIVEAMQEKGIPVTYVLYPDEGHGFARPENRLSFFGVTEAFLAEHLGGRFQPLGESDVEGSSITVPTGGDGVPGLAEVLETP